MIKDKYIKIIDKKYDKEDIVNEK